VRFQLLTAASVKVVILWNVADCSLVEIDRSLRGAYYLAALMMDAVRTSETSVSFYQMTRRNIAEDSNFRNIFYNIAS
jgi:hypothetical protein